VEGKRVIFVCQEDNQIGIIDIALILLLLLLLLLLPINIINIIIIMFHLNYFLFRNTYPA